MASGREQIKTGLEEYMKSITPTTAATHVAAAMLTVGMIAAPAMAAATPLAPGDGQDTAAAAASAVVQARSAASVPDQAQPVAPAPDQAPPAASAPDTYTTDNLGGGFFHRLFGYYKLELGHSSAPAHPSAPSSRQEGWSPAPETTPPMPFTEWPYGGASSMGVTRPNSVDSPLMTALAPSSLGQALSKAHIQAYGWIDVGGNYGSNSVQGGNAPGAYDYEPRRIQLDQAVMYVERAPDTVQTDHVDWGFRVSAIYGVDYRYTISYGLFSGQLTTRNNDYGFDMPMVYGELYIPQIAKGLLIRVGRFISVPDIEAQLAPNNYMYSHSMTYTFDNYTNTGILGTLAVSKNLFLQAGITVGTDTAFWNAGKQRSNPFPNPLYPGTSFPKDPGLLPSFTGCIRYQTSDAGTAIYGCVNGINSGRYGYNNLQWRGLTIYHKFSDKWHISLETYNIVERDVPNALNPVAQNAIAMGGTPFSPQYLLFNAPGTAQCNDPNALRCDTYVQSGLMYLNYSPSPLDNFSLRAEYFDDQEGQRTGVKTRYAAGAIGWQRWLSPQIELRPELAFYRSLDAPAFNGSSNRGIAPNKQDSVVLSGDVIVHF